MGIPAAGDGAASVENFPQISGNFRSFPPVSLRFRIWRDIMLSSTNISKTGSPGHDPAGLVCVFGGSAGEEAVFVLNKRQRDFAEYYIQCGNASEAARKAGYSENTAGDANKWLNPKKPQKYKPELSEYISERIAELQKQKMATADEVVVFFTSVLRGEKQGNEIPSIKHRLEAGKEILKRVGAVDTEDTDALFGEAGLK